MPEKIEQRKSLKCGKTYYTLVCNNCDSDIEMTNPSSRTTLGPEHSLLKYECPNCGCFTIMETKVRWETPKLAEVLDITGRLNEKERQVPTGDKTAP